MTNIETFYTDARAQFEDWFEHCTDPDEREALAAAICTCNESIAEERARVAAQGGMSA